MLGDGLRIDRPVLELGRALDQLLRNAESNLLLAVRRVGERQRNSMACLLQHPVLDDQMRIAHLDDVAELAVIARDDFVPFHGNLPLGLLAGFAYPRGAGS